MVEKAYACHNECQPGDFECHHKCPKMFNQGHHFPGNWKHKFQLELEKVHACHERCGGDSACHTTKCPKPWMKFVKACKEFPAKHFMMAAEKKCPKMLEIHACHESCKLGDHECRQKCPSMWDLFHGHHSQHHHEHHDFHHHDHEW